MSEQFDEAMFTGSYEDRNGPATTVRGPVIPADFFVREYKACQKAGKTWKDLADTLGQPVSTVKARYKNLVKNKVNLGPQLGGAGQKGQKIDTARLNALIAELEKENPSS